MPATTKVTLGHVAEAAGVSVASASLALRGKAGVGETTRARVVAAATDLGYRVRSGPDGRPESIAVIVKSRPDDPVSTNAFYGPVISGVTAACKAAGIDLILDSMMVDDRSNLLEEPRIATSRDVDGVLVLGARLSPAALAVLDQAPLVLVDGYAPMAVTSIITDNLGGAASATRHVIEHGHERIAMVGCVPTSYPSILERRRGYEQAMAEHGLAVQTIDVDHHEAEACGAEAVTAVTGPHGVTAIVAANDLTALAVMRHLAAAGIDVPGQVSVVGFDDIETAALVRPALSTVAVDKSAMGRLAVAMLSHRFTHRDDPVFTTVQQTELVVRDTVAAPS